LPSLKNMGERSMGRIAIPEARDLPAIADVVIIGGGIVGTATAFYASRAGLKTLVLEMRDGLATLTTTSSLECIRAQFEEPENIAMMKASIDIFESFAEVVGLPNYEIDLHQQGYLFLSADPDGPAVLKERVGRQRSLGLEDVEFLSGDEARARFPYLSPTVTAATYHARDGWLSSHEATYGFAKGSAARFFLEAEVTGFLIDEQGVAGAETNRGIVHSRAVVVAAGPFSGHVAQLAGVELPLSVLRRHKVIIGQHPLIPHDAPMTIDLGSGANWLPQGPGAVMA
jgi:sarcosine oxidase subunit beta